MYVLITSRFLQQNLEEYLQQKDDSGTKHVNISRRLDSWCQVFTAIKHDKCSFLCYDTTAAITLPWIFMFMNCDALPCITGGHGCEILCSHSRVTEDSSLLGGNTVLLGKWFLMLRTVPLSSDYSRWLWRWLTVNIHNFKNH